MLDMYIFETTQMSEQLEQAVILSEKSGGFNSAAINDIFRIMHTIKGSSAMMLFDNIAALAHAVEDVFFYLREAKPTSSDCSKLSDLILASLDFIRTELEQIKGGGGAQGDSSCLIQDLKDYLQVLKQDNPSTVAVKDRQDTAAKQQYYISQDKSATSGKKNFFQATIFFEDGCEMENVRAYTVIHSLKDIADDIFHVPENIMEDDSTAEIIRQEGFQIFFASDRGFDEINKFFDNTIFLKELKLAEIDNQALQERPARKRQIVLEDQPAQGPDDKEQLLPDKEKEVHSSGHQSIISVNVDKLDRLMDLVGELVISEAMVTQNPDLRGLTLDNFSKSARQLEKITGELQDMVMSIRMVPLKTTFHKMHRIVRDMCKKLGKEVQLELIGEDTEVDKNIIEHISDPLMHLIRNSLDHGIEPGDERLAVGKTAIGKITLEARNAGSDVVIMIKDDGRGLNRDKILARARDNGLLNKPENELTDKEIYAFIFTPGFSTKDKVTEFSGRGVGMDVVTKNIYSVGGMVLIDSAAGLGSTISLKIPLTLAIIDGMTVGVGGARYTIPITAVKESFRPRQQDLIQDPDGNEMIMVRGRCYPILRIHRAFKVATSVTELIDGIIIMVENENDTLCLFADELIGQQQVVVKALPAYIKGLRKVAGLAGCTLLGDGSISLILDIGGMTSIGYSS
ncbi:MAG: chemotaxis protein CheA [Negativicutes bacterium]|nr:chemotaxis protein CheA [Negativicutes bacterium]